MPPKIDLSTSGDDDDVPPPASPPAKQPPAKKTIINLDTDDDDDSATKAPPPPPAKPAAKVKIVLDDTGSDNDNSDPPPPATRPRASESVLPREDSEAPPPPPKSSAPPPPKVAAQAPLAKPAARLRNVRAETVRRRNVNEITKEGFLNKQSPSWPYSQQKRWVVLKGRVMSYYEAQSSANPAGILELKGAEIVDVSKQAKVAPHSFGVTGPSGVLKGRTFIFAASSREDLDSWVETIMLVSTEPKSSELHWFEKMAQGMF